MGRIDEALRRSGIERDSTSQATSAPSQTNVMFVSPWSFREPSTVVAPAAPALPTPTAVAEPTPPAAEPVLVSLPLEARSEDELTAFRGFQEEWLVRLVVAPDANAQLVEQFRQLAATLHHCQALNNTRIVMLTSAEPNEGKSLTAVNLALTLSESYGRRVLLVDADLRRPSLHQIAGLPNGSGLSDTLRSSKEQKVPVFRISDTLMLATAGRPDGDPMRALSSVRMRHIMQDAARRFDWVILDAPPIGPIADSSLLAPFTDGTLLVVRAGRTHHALVQKAVDAIGRDRILGIVLNGADPSDGSTYRQY